MSVVAVARTIRRRIVNMNSLWLELLARGKSHLASFGYKNSADAYHTCEMRAQWTGNTVGLNQLLIRWPRSCIMWPA